MRSRNRYFIVHDLSSLGDAKQIKQAANFTLCKMADSKSVEPTGSFVHEYRTSEEFRIASSSVLFTDYSGGSDKAFVNAYERFTTNDKNEGRKIRQAIAAWSARNAASWSDNYHRSVWSYYDDLSQRLSDGALIPAQSVLSFIPDDIPELGNTSNLIDVSSLNDLLGDLLQDVFDKYPR